MKQVKSLSILIITLIAFQPLFSQKTSKPVYVLVHGAWGGGWAFKGIDSLLTELGSKVYRPTLTGQGERSHLASTSIGLNTHITDIVNTILFEDLHDVILVGHSYGGVVVTGVADSIPSRIKKLIYIDAILPDNGESVESIMGSAKEGPFKNVNGFVVPPWLREGQASPKDVPHPYKTWTDKIVLNNPLRLKIPTTYILTVEKGKEAKDDDFAAQADKAKKKNWTILQLEADHNAQWSAPKELVKMLEEIAKK